MLFRSGHKVGHHDPEKNKYVDGDKGKTALDYYINPSVFDKWKEGIRE